MYTFFNKTSQQIIAKTRTKLKSTTIGIPQTFYITKLTVDLFTHYDN